MTFNFIRVVSYLPMLASFAYRSEALPTNLWGHLWFLTEHSLCTCKTFIFYELHLLVEHN